MYNKEENISNKMVSEDCPQVVPVDIFTHIPPPKHINIRTQTKIK